MAADRWSVVADRVPPTAAADGQEVMRENGAPATLRSPDPVWQAWNIENCSQVLLAATGSAGRVKE
ncbi:hypothetical protein GCM10027456_46820 [Kineosporia babensis]